MFATSSRNTSNVIYIIRFLLIYFNLYLKQVVTWQKTTIYVFSSITILSELSNNVSLHSTDFNFGLCLMPLFCFRLSLSDTSMRNQVRQTLSLIPLVFTLSKYQTVKGGLIRKQLRSSSISRLGAFKYHSLFCQYFIRNAT